MEEAIDDYNVLFGTPILAILNMHKYQTEPYITHVFSKHDLFALQQNFYVEKTSYRYTRISFPSWIIKETL